MKLYYAHDPMCSWCWALRPVWKKVESQLPDNLTLEVILGGLAPDTDEPMPMEMQNTIQATWHKIQTQIPDTEFNFDFWTQCQPRRSTYASCRAVIATGWQNPLYKPDMTLAIQKAYYLQARNPSDDDTLIELATQIGIDPEQFTRDLNAAKTHTELKRQIDLCESLDAFSFPSIILKTNNVIRPVALNYSSADTLLESINLLIELD